MNTITHSSAYRSNILGATGLPRAILAAMFLRDGLFGRDSDLSREEQAVLQSRLPAIRGLAAPAPVKPFTPRLSVLSDLADALVRGDEACAERTRAVRVGFSAGAVSEIQTVVGSVVEVFGPFAEQSRTGQANQSKQALAAVA